MKRAWILSVSILAVALGASASACGGSADVSGGASGASAGGAAPTSGGAGASLAGASVGAGGAGANSGVAGASNAGSGTTNGGASHAGAPNSNECDSAACGPQLGLPNWICADGGIGGPTGRCIRQPEGSCGWEIDNCPRAAVGGAGAGGASQGGQGNTAGASTTGGASSTDCGTCPSGQVCVFQHGGPGPAHFVCATWTPCTSAAACACIVGQGACSSTPMGDPPRYCSCENGLD